jgi:hypothetical protein
MAEKGEILLKPSDSVKKDGIISSALFLFLTATCFFVFLIDLEIISNEPTLNNPIMVGFSSLLLLILSISSLIDNKIRFELALTNKKIITPYKRFFLFSFKKKKEIYWVEINSIHLYKNFIKIDRRFYSKNISIFVNGKEFKEIIETEFPRYISKIKN